MPFRGLTMLKSPKLTIKGGLCYVFAMVLFFISDIIRVSMPQCLHVTCSRRGEQRWGHAGGRTSPRQRGHHSRGGRHRTAQWEDMSWSSNFSLFV